MPLHITAHQDPPDVGALRWHPLRRLAERLDQRTDDADKEAAANGLLVYAPSRWRRTYRDARFLLDQDGDA